MNMIRVAIVEDDIELRKLTAALLNFYPDTEVVGNFKSAEEFHFALPNLCPDVVLMDIGLPAQNGIECIRQHKSQLPDIQYIILTSNPDAQPIFDALAAGASGYLTKPSPPEKIVAAIREVATGGSPMSSQIARLVVDSFRRTEPKFPELAKLSPQELKILESLRLGLAYKQIAAENFIAMGTVRTHVRSIYEKLEVHCRTEALNKAFGK